MVVASDNSSSKGRWVALIILGVILVLLGALAGGYLFVNLVAVWWTTITLLVVFLVTAGLYTSGHSLGILIDDRNKISLSRLQAVIWTLILTSSFFAVSLGNSATAHSDPLNFAIPGELLILAGISAASLVGSPLVKSTKKKKPPNDEEFARTKTEIERNQSAGDGVVVSAVGQILVNESPRAARIADLFSGEETSNGSSLDLAKIQMLFFTVVIVLTYSAQMLSDLAAGGFINTLPPLSSSTVTLLGISHAAYLTHKAIPLSATKAV